MKTLRIALVRSWTWYDCYFWCILRCLIVPAVLTCVSLKMSCGRRCCFSLGLNSEVVRQVRCWCECWREYHLRIEISVTGSSRGLQTKRRSRPLILKNFPLEKLYGKIKFWSADCEVSSSLAFYVRIFKWWYLLIPSIVFDENLMVGKRAKRRFSTDRKF